MTPYTYNRCFAYQKGDIITSMDAITPKDMPIMSSNGNGNGNGRHRLDEERTQLFNKGSFFEPVQREDIAGIDSIVDRLEKIAHWLQHAEEYLQYNARLEPGLILSGEPGTGKTMSARYLATVSNAHFVNVREFPIEGDMHTADDIKDLFAYARAYYVEHHQPIILFWDEFEGCAKERSKASPAQAAVVSELTAQLDGVSGKGQGVLLIGCTNYMGDIDHALKRSGRMGMKIDFHAPDMAGRTILLRHYLQSFTAEEMDIPALAACCTDFSAARIEELVNEAWLLAVSEIIGTDRQPLISKSDILNVILDSVIGLRDPNTNLPQDELHRVAVHEVGHALVSAALQKNIILITVRPSSNSLGKVVYREESEHMHGVQDSFNRACTALGGLSAEKTAQLPAHAGAANDIEQATLTLAGLINAGFAPGPLQAINSQALVRARSNTQRPSISQGMVEVADRQLRTLTETVSQFTQQLLDTVGADALHTLADTLIERETMLGGEFVEYAEGLIGPLSQLYAVMPGIDVVADILISNTQDANGDL